MAAYIPVPRDLTQHPNYKLTGNHDPKKMFDIEKFLDRHLKLKPSDTYDVVEADESQPNHNPA